MYQNAKELRRGERGTSTHWHWGVNCYKLLGSQLGNTYKNQNFTCPLSHLLEIYPTDYILQNIFQTMLKEIGRKILIAIEFTVV